MNFNTATNKITVKTEAADKNNNALFEWSADPASGNVTSTKRASDGSREQVLMKNDGQYAFDLKNYEAQTKVAKQETPEILSTSSETDSLKPNEMTQEEWDEIEA